MAATIPRFAFEKFPQAAPTLTTQMKNVGEAMAIGRTSKESLQECLRSLKIARRLAGRDAEQIFFIRHALHAGSGTEDIFSLTRSRPLVPDPGQGDREFRGKARAVSMGMSGPPIRH